MNHLTEDEMIDRHYGEGGSAPAGHLETCAACKGAYVALQADLAELDPIAPPERPLSYGEQVWSRLAPLLPAFPERNRIRARRGLWLAFGSAAACAAVVAAAFYAGRLWEHRQPQQQARATQANVPSPTPERVVVVLLSDHLDRSERVLIELKHARSDDPQVVAPLRDEAIGLLQSNRKWRQEAEKSGDPDLALVLNNLNDLLSQLANEREQLNPAELAKLQREMKADGLLLDVRVLRSRIPNRQAGPSHLKGGTA